ncbi:hypothetical protein [Arthrobacter sp. ISL-28]|uniref:hypothetical protein n=1 Tax=Arthrobacter sp. ISL-28 TaxID=2819108 RepID=UPI001BE68F4B|nr:hypothetical protein [Arthrobacter sp. ISL-28]MBT2520343.1 hypothetical protein [Arthrobacter sp. ISL-28]
MTENQWPQDGSLTVPPAPQNSKAYGSGVSSGSPAAASKTDTAKEEAATVAGQAAGAAQNVAGAAKAEAANVASEAKTNAKDLLFQAKSDLADQAGVQQQKAAEGIRTISSQLRTMADAPEQQGVAADLVRQAAQRSESVASWLENRDPGSLLDEVKTFARQRPGTFLLLAASAGVLAGRLGRSLQAGAPAATSATGTSVPPQPVQPPVTASAIGAGVGEPLYDETTQGQPSYAQPTYGTPAYGEPTASEPRFGEPGHTQPGYAEPTRSATAPASSQVLPGGSAGAVPLRDVDDPFAEGEGRQL